MNEFEKVNLRNLVIHKVGNPSKGDEVILSEKPVNLFNDELNEVLVNYLLQSFDTNELYQFHHMSSLAMNEVYQ
ncbi:MAG: nucleoid-associated protein, partial [Chitinophagaceae bacterium]